MAELRIIPVSNNTEKDRFIELPWTLYKDYPLWVPPIKKQERTLLTPGAHPYWENAKGQLFLALRGNTPVGRIAAIVDHNYNRYTNQRCGAWGFFECAHDKEAAHALFAATAAWHKEQGMEFMRGPLNPSTNYTCGMLVDGFDLAPSIMMPWNPPYYPEFTETWYMRKEQDLFAYNFNAKTVQFSPWVFEQIESVKARTEFTWRASSKATMENDIHIMLDIYQESWAKNWGFTPLSLAEAKNHIHELKNILDPDFFILLYCNGQPAGGMLALPDMNPLLKKLNGSIGITAPWHFWRTQADIKGSYRLMLFGIREAYRLMGIPLFLVSILLEKAKNHDILHSVEGSWSLEDNFMINDLLEDLGGLITKRYRIYRRDLASL